jgi:hypothetical protein
VEFDKIYSFNVGSELVRFGRLKKPETSGPQVYAAALDEYGLRHAQAGFGASEAEAAADLFRYLRDNGAL